MADLAHISQETRRTVRKILIRHALRKHFLLILGIVSEVANAVQWLIFWLYMKFWLLIAFSSVAESQISYVILELEDGGAKG
jgi:hypothetical protein